MKAVCQHCGQEFNGVGGGNGKPPKFCNRSCYDNYRTEQRAICLHCGNRIKPSRPKGAKFCSHECRVVHKKPEPRPCTNCGTIFTPIKFNTSTQRIVAYNAGKTCSETCQLEWYKTNPERKAKISAAFKGAKHPNWKDGRAAINISEHRGKGWYVLAGHARKRDGFKCAVCGKTEEDAGRKLDVHHIIPYHDHPDRSAANRLDNLITLCKSCHQIAEWHGLDAARESAKGKPEAA